MHKIAQKFTELKELLKKVSGRKDGYDRYELIENYLKTYISSDSIEYLFSYENKEESIDQLADGLVEPIYKVYRITLQDILTGEIKAIFIKNNAEIANESFSNGKIIPLIAIYSQFSQRRISIYPFPDKIVDSLVEQVKNCSNKLFLQLRETDNFLSKCEMTQAYYAIKFDNELPLQEKFPFKFEREKISTELTNEKRQNLFNDLYNYKFNDLYNYKKTSNFTKNTNNYLEKIRKQYNKLEENDSIDFALSSLLTAHSNIYVYNLSFSDKAFAHRSIVFLLDKNEKSMLDGDKKHWEYLVYKIDHILSYVLAFESQLRTYDMFLRSSEFVLKKDQDKWQRIKEQIKFGNNINNAILGKGYQKIKYHYNNTGSPQLQQEIDRKMLNSLASLLPELQDSIDAVEHSLYRMPRYFSKSLRTLLLKQGVFEPTTALDLYKNVLEEVKKCFYMFKIEKPISPELYIEKRCYKKYATRFKESSDLAEFLANKQFRTNYYKKDSLIESSKSYDKQRSLEILRDLFSNKFDVIQTEYNIILNDSIVKYYDDRLNIDLPDLINSIKKERTKKITLTNFNCYLLGKNSKVQSLITPPESEIRLIHGDLHFDNILIDPFDLNNPIDKLIDPGDFYSEGGDIAYDLGKLMHSFNGLYDFIHEGLYDVSYEIDDKKLIYTININANEYIFRRPFSTGGSGAEVVGYSPLYGGEIVNYLYIRAKNESIIKKVFSDFGNKSIEKLIKRAKFNEALHFLTMAPFHMTVDPKRTLAIYVTGLILMDLWLHENKIIKKTKEGKK